MSTSPAFERPLNIWGQSLAFVGRRGPYLDYGDDQTAAVVLAPAGMIARDRHDVFYLVREDLQEACNAVCDRFINLGETLVKRQLQHSTPVIGIERLGATVVWRTKPLKRPLANIDTPGRLDEAIVKAFIRRLAEALEELRTNGLAHGRGFDPGMIDIANGQVRLGPVSPDLRDLLEPLGPDALVGGAFAPPEAYDGLRRRPIDCRSDLYSAAAVVLWLATGTRPPPAVAPERFKGAAMWPVSSVGATFGSLRAASEKALSLRPDDRFENARAWAEGASVAWEHLPERAASSAWFSPATEPKAVEEGTPVSGPLNATPDAEQEPKPKPKPRRRRIGAMGGVIVAFLVAATGAVALERRVRTGVWGEAPEAPRACQWRLDRAASPDGSGQPGAWVLRCKVDGEWSRAPTFDRFDYATVRRSKEGYPAAQERLGEFYRRMGERGRAEDREEAVAWLTKAADGGEQVAMRTLGVLRREQGLSAAGAQRNALLAECERWLRAALAAAPSDQQARLELARTLETLGRPDEALALFAIGSDRTTNVEPAADSPVQRLEGSGAPTTAMDGEARGATDGSVRPNGTSVVRPSGQMSSEGLTRELNTADDPSSRLNRQRPPVPSQNSVQTLRYSNLRSGESAAAAAGPQFCRDRNQNHVSSAIAAGAQSSCPVDRDACFIDVVHTCAATGAPQ